ncbi:hypothetical protein H072_6436 [Dactylellina haptotyla CBS 200.50]|uniref:Uncharacterized protein n=1 Tax=Dactylellina haptotyla (strain CBS 200.50) TaxID=1284197 RepID=S8BK94_DACHA|nr:hypothetical protein H072_6436 [Dactylellina haptotyla CBS 200.50]
MSTHNEKIEEGLLKLIEHILPELEDEDEDEALKDNALELARGMIESHAAPPEADDPAHIGNIIRNKLIRENRTSDKALRFANLYSRFLAAPIVKKKAPLLHLLHKLSESTGSERESTSRASNGAQSSAATSRAQSRADFGTDTRRPSTSTPDIQDDFDPNAPPKPFLAPERGDGKTNEVTKAALLANLNLPSEPSEVALLKDIPFTLQGVSSKTLTFTSENTLKLPPNLPIPLISLLHTLAEPALLYRFLSAFVEDSDSVEGKGGLVGQSLSAAVGNELKAYLSLVAGLEGEVRRAMSMIDENDEHGLSVRKVGVTLKRCVIWTREATMGLRLMAAIVGESRGKRGGQLISIIHGFSTSHGDPFVFNFAKRLLASVTRPFYDLLRRWVYDGELTDPYLEFFVIEQSEEAIAEASNERRGHASSVWQDKYKLDDEMVPTIMTSEFANKVFLIGKSLNFIRYGCDDSEWVEKYSKTTSKELSHDDYASLEQQIDEAYKTTMARLMHLMNKKFNLFDHLCALKKFLLLGQGDFIALLMESLSSNLDRPANTLYRHNLTAQLEHAIRGSNAQYESQEVLRRLDARMLELSHGEIGWDVFTLEYKIDPPVDVVVTPYGSREYLKVFNFLWRIKRVEFALGSAWKKYMTGARGVLGSVADKVGTDWKVARCCIAEMIHFVAQLQYYILFQVIEPSWEKLMASMNKPNVTLDDLIDAHKLYLTSITRKGLLGGAAKSRQPEMSFLAQLHEILKNMLAYKDAMDGLYSCSVAEFTRRQAAAALIEARTAAGKWGASESDAPYEFSQQVKKHSRPKDDTSDSNSDSDDDGDDEQLPVIRQRLKTLTAEFQARTSVLLGDLANQPDMDMRFLGVMFSFNDFYVVKKGRGKTVVERRSAQKGDETPG